MSVGDIRVSDNKKQQEGNEDGERGEETIKWEKHRRKERGHCRQEQKRGSEGAPEEEEGGNNNSLVLPLYSDKFPSHRGVGGLAEAGVH